MEGSDKLKNILSEENAETSNDQATENQKDNGLIESKNSAHKIQYLTIVGQIEGHTMLPPQTKSTKYEHVIPQLVSIEDDNTIAGLLILLNTVGGDVEAGLAIAEMISGMSKPTVSLVLGGGHSIGVPLAVAAKQSFIVPSATMTIHPIRMSGVVIGTSQTYDYFNRVQERVIDFIVRNSKISSEQFNVLIRQTGVLANDVGTILFGEEAVNHGIIDHVGSINQVLKTLHELIEKTHNDNGKPSK
ncbi:MAG: translocation-enhancing protein TepA [Clostridiaceae bacterium]|jgi:ATP-dependent protease ClpP protease subunit|nr:translocation-enhancing protein TepA [Clostridiaceae bacterium]